MTSLLTARRDAARSGSGAGEIWITSSGREGAAEEFLLLSRPIDVVGSVSICQTESENFRTREGRLSGG